MKKYKIVLLMIVVLLIIVRAALPYAAKRYANHELSTLKEYQGSVGDIDISLIRGAYRAHDFQLFRKTGKVPVPFVSARQIDLSVEWKSLLFHGQVVAEMDVQHPELNIVDGPTPAQSQKKPEAGLKRVADKLIPLKLNRLSMRDGEVHFRNLVSKPPVDLHLKKVSLDAHNLSNVEKTGKELPSTVKMHGIAMNEAPFDMTVKLDALKNPPDFDMDGNLKSLPLVKLNDFFKQYANVDVERGSLTVSTELASKNGTLAGYVKPIMKDLEVVDIGKDAKKGPFALFWQSFAGTIGDLLQHDDKQATKVPIHGSILHPKTDTWGAIGSAFSHAFGKPLQPGVENTVNLQTAKQAAGKKAREKDEDKDKDKPRDQEKHEDKKD